MITRIRNAAALLLANLAARLHADGARAVVEKLQPNGGGGPRPVVPK